MPFSHQHEKPALERGNKKHLSRLYADSADLTARFRTKKKKGVDLEACDVFFRPRRLKAGENIWNPIGSKEWYIYRYLPTFTITIR